MTVYKFYTKMNTMTKVATRVKTKIRKASVKTNVKTSVKTSVKTNVKTKQVYNKKQRHRGNICRHKSNKNNELHRMKKRNKEWMSETQRDNNPLKKQIIKTQLDYFTKSGASYLQSIPEEQAPTTTTLKPTVETPPILKKGNITFTELKKSNFDDLFDDRNGFMFQKIHSLYEFDNTKFIKVF
jgi:predicted DNA binding protein